MWQGLFSKLLSTLTLKFDHFAPLTSNLMSYIYEWANAEQTILKRICTEHGECAWVPNDPANRDYAEFLSSGAIAVDYVEPPEPTPLTAEEKLNAAGLTVDELKALLAS